MAKAPADIRSLARSHTATAIRTLAGIMEQKDAPASARVSAAEALLSRGWGKPAQPHTDNEGGPIRIVVEYHDPTREIAPVEELKVIEHSEVDDD